MVVDACDVELLRNGLRHADGAYYLLDIYGKSWTFEYVHLSCMTITTKREVSKIRITPV